MRNVKNMVATSIAVDKIIEAKTKKPSKQEAAKILRSCGILDSQNNIKSAHKDIVIKR